MRQIKTNGIVADDIKANNGELAIGSLETEINIQGSEIKLQDGSEGTVGHVWTSTDLEGGGNWAPVAGGSGSPGGADTNVQFNNAGDFGGSASLTWDDTDGSLRIAMKTGNKDALIITCGEDTTLQKNIRFADALFPLVDGHISMSGVGAESPFSGAGQFEFIFGTVQTHPTYGKTAWYTASQRIFSVSGGGNPTLTFQKSIHMDAENHVRFMDADNSNSVGFKAAADISSDVTWTLPAADGSSGEVLSTNGSGVLSWAAAGGGSSGWTKYSVSYSDLTSGAFELVSLPAAHMIEKVVIRNTTEFAGGSLTGYTISVGIPGNTNAVSSAFNVYAPVSGTNFLSGNTALIADMDDPIPVSVFAFGVGDTVDNASQGEAEIWIKVTDINS